VYKLISWASFSLLYSGRLTKNCCKLLRIKATLCSSTFGSFSNKLGLLTSLLSGVFALSSALFSSERSSFCSFSFSWKSF
jgi:hypothetical protein